MLFLFFIYQHFPLAVLSSASTFEQTFLQEFAGDEFHNVLCYVAMSVGCFNSGSLRIVLEAFKHFLLGSVQILLGSRTGLWGSAVVL